MPPAPGDHFLHLEGTGIVRQAELGDLPTILHIAAHTRGAPPWSDEAYTTALQNSPESPYLRCLLVLQAGESLVAFGTVTLLRAVSPPEAELEGIVVKEEAQGCGFGARLLAALIRWTAAQGAAVLRLEVRASNLRAIRLYQRQGFRSEGMRRRYYRDPVEDAERMVREVPGTAPKRS